MERRWRYVLGAALLSDAVALFACESSIEREATPRYYIPPDVEEDAKIIVPDAEATDAEADAADGSMDGGDGGYVLAPPMTLTSGGAFHPDPVVGYGDHTCTVATAERSVWCWGANDHGQLGVGSTGQGTVTADVAVATRITVDETGLPFAGIDEVTASGWVTCARKKDVLFCWGERYTGAQAEPPNSGDAGVVDRTRPRAIGNLDVDRVTATGPHTCALTSNGARVCFGHNTFGELGRANTDDATCAAPFFYDYEGTSTHKCGGTLIEATTTIPSVRAITSGALHGCALTADRVRCWGTNLAGQLGRPGGQAAEIVPQEVVTDPALLTALDGVTSLASGGEHSCAVRAGVVYCWGKNDAGQLATSSATTPSRAFAAPVAGLTNVATVAVGERVSCALKTDKTVLCWGADLANPVDLTDGGVSVTPTQIKGPGGVGVLDDVEALAPGYRHVCARRNDGVYCWGKNDRGQLGDGTKVDSMFPVKVVGLP